VEYFYTARTKEKKMYDLTNYQSIKRLYGEVRAGWHDKAFVYQTGVKNGISKKTGKEYQYILIDFEIQGVLVPFYSFYKEGQKKPDPAFGKLCWIAGLLGQDYRGNKMGLLKALRGTEMQVKVVHRFPKIQGKAVRRDEVVDFAPLHYAEPDEVAEETRDDRKDDFEKNPDF
jgi:hypothetical protein